MGLTGQTTGKTLCDFCSHPYGQHEMLQGVHYYTRSKPVNYTQVVQVQPWAILCPDAQHSPGCTTLATMESIGAGDPCWWSAAASQGVQETTRASKYRRARMRRSRCGRIRMRTSQSGKTWMIHIRGCMHMRPVSAQYIEYKYYSDISFILDYYSYYIPLQPAHWIALSGSKIAIFHYNVNTKTNWFPFPVNCYFFSTTYVQGN